MSEEFTLKVTLQGVDDASDEIKSVTEGLRRLGAENEALVQRAKEILKEDREQKRVLKAIAEEAEIFNDKIMFTAEQLNRVAGFASRVNNIFTQYNTLMTRINTAQLNYNNALRDQAMLLEEVNMKFNIGAENVTEALQILQELRAEYAYSGESTKELDKYIRQLTESEKQLTKAQNEVINSQQQMQAQMITLGLQAVGLVPQFMQMVNSLSTFTSLVGPLQAGLGAVKAAFTGLYAAMGPVGLILMALSVIIPIIVAHWEQIRGALEAVGQAIWSVVGPALQWLWDNILKPLVGFLISYFVNAWRGVQIILEAGGVAAKAVGDALSWLWNNIIKPFIDWLINYSVNQLKAWVAVFEWIRDRMREIWDAIVGVIKGAIDWILDKINAVKNAIFNAFDWLHKQLVGGSIVPDMMSDIVAWTKWGISEVDKMMSDFGVSVMGPKVVGGINVVVNVSGANVSADEIAQAVSRAILRNLRGMGT
ncbi:MAG: hypothetical protein QW555_08050 [Nitrososphaerota archaeon]